MLAVFRGCRGLAAGHGIAALLALTACASTPDAGPASATVAPITLEGTSWQLVRFEGGDDTIRVPDDPAKYTIDFQSGGRVAVRIDCNRGSGTWKSAGPQLEFGPLAVTRALCPADSMHDQIVKHWGFIRSYVIENGHLFLALMADGGIYEFAPAAGGEAR